VDWLTRQYAAYQCCASCILLNCKAIISYSGGVLEVSVRHFPQVAGFGEQRPQGTSVRHFPQEAGFGERCVGQTLGGNHYSHHTLRPSSASPENSRPKNEVLAVRLTGECVQEADCPSLARQSTIAASTGTAKGKRFLLDRRRSLQAYPLDPSFKPTTLSNWNSQIYKRERDVL
jgi:hypothetical protein